MKKLTKKELHQATSPAQSQREATLSGSRSTRSPQRWRCIPCGYESNTLTGKRGIETHVDTEHGGGRYECVLECQ